MNARCIVFLKKVLIIAFFLTHVACGSGGDANPDGSDETPESGDTSSIESRIVFVSNRDGGMDIYTMDGYGGDVIKVTDFSTNSVDPSWSPDKSRIVFSLGSDIYAIDADGSNLQELLKDKSFNGLPAWSPDGNTIVFSSNRSGDMEVWAMDNDGSNLRNLSNYPSAGDWDPYWSPDGSRIAFQSGREGYTEIYTMNPDGTDQARVTWSTGNYDPSWSPDGQWIAYTHGIPGDIFITNVDNLGKDVNLTSSDNYTEAGAVWSPDSMYLAFSRAGLSGDDKPDIFVMKSDGTELENLTDLPSVGDSAADW